MAKYIFVVGGVISGTGKGVAAASIGLLLRLRGHKELTYLLKDINNNKLWEDLSRVYKDVDYTAMYEEEDNTKLMENVACARGACSIF